MMTHDIRLVVGGEKVTIAIKPETPEPEIVKEIDAALNKLLLGRSLGRATLYTSVNAGVSARTMRSVEKYVPDPTSATGEEGPFGKTVRVKHVEAWFLDKGIRVNYRRQASRHWGVAHVTAKMTEGAPHRVRSPEWMKKHDEVFPIAGET
jgi:hypothetical protein